MICDICKRNLGNEDRELTVRNVNGSDKNVYIHRRVCLDKNNLYIYHKQNKEAGE